MLVPIPGTRQYGPAVNDHAPQPGTHAGDELTPAELRDRVAYALLLPAIRLARVKGVPLKRIVQWLHIAYFRELRTAGFKMRECAERLGVSMRKVAQLSKSLKVNFLEPDRDVGLPRRIEFLLWAGPLSRARIYQALPEELRSDIDRAIDGLIGEERIVERRTGRTTVCQANRSSSRLVSRDWRARIDGLNNLLANVVHAVHGRFFADDPQTFARTVSFRVREKDIAELAELYESVVWQRIQELEQRAAGDGDAVSLDLSMCWAPFDYLRTRPSQEDEENHEDIEEN